MVGPTPIEKRKLFQGHPLFGNLPPDDLDALLTRARVERYRAGQEVFAKGTPGRSMMAILNGNVRISSPSSAGREFVLTILSPGEVFGEIALLDGRDRTADATAITECELLVLDHRDFIPFLERRGDLCILLLKVLCQRLRQTDEYVEDAVFERLDNRMAKALVRLAKTAGAKDGGSVVSLRVSQRDLAGMVGATRESVNKQLHVWQRAGLLKLGKRLIQIPDVDALEAEA
jgi:CRP/FNR family cyclic AMP-dependent transcriptional regulator